MALPGPVGEEMGRVLGGGVVPGSVTLVGGEPGVGKSTLLLQVRAALGVRGGPGGTHSCAPDHLDPPLQIAALLAAAGDQEEDDGARPVLYVSAEESTEQVGSRAERMQLGAVAQNIFLYRCSGGVGVVAKRDGRVCKAWCSIAWLSWL